MRVVSMSVLFHLLLAFAIKAHASAQVHVMFHPNEATLATIADRMQEAEFHIDIAMYNMDVVGQSALVAWLRSPTTQTRLQLGTLKMRVLLNGTPKTEKVALKMGEIEQLGADVRWLSSSRELHHKFAVIDSGRPKAKVISGSANWSESSRLSYDENIFFVQGDLSLVSAFQNQFNLLWQMGEEFGAIGLRQDVAQQAEPLPTSGISSFFNVPSADWEKVDLKSLQVEDYRLTQKFVSAIDSAQTEIKVASTRLRLAPLYAALVRAAQRGVRIQVLLTQAEYAPWFIRQKIVKPNCDSIFASECSKGINYAIPLLTETGVEIRVKQFSFRGTDAIRQQMHSKYLVIDDTLILTGSFNFSFSSEFNNFENVVQFAAPTQRAVIQKYQENFNHMWGQNRHLYPEFLKALDVSLASSQDISCIFAPMSLSFAEMDAVLDIARQRRVRLAEVCN